MLLLETREQVVDQLAVEVGAAEEGVAAGGDDFVDAAVQLQHAGIEGAAAQVVDHHALLQLASVGEGDGRGGGLVEDALHFESGQSAGGADGLALVVIVVGGDGDDGARDWLVQPALGELLDFAEHQRGNFLQ